MLHKRKYDNGIWMYIDFVSFILAYPWLSSVNYLLASFIPTTGDTSTLKYVNYFIVGPCSLVLAILLMPVGMAGVILWVVLWICAEPVPYRYWEFPNAKDAKSSLFSENMCIATANLCLLPDFLSKFNNNGLTFKRCLKIAKNIMSNKFQSRSTVKGPAAPDDVGENSHIIPEFPHLDFMCFQEVWGRVPAWLLILTLKNHFGYFLYDVGKDKWSINRFFLGSGLMFASKYPILEADFQHFTAKTFQGHFTSIGLLQVKVLLQNTPERLVGYIATTHLQSYQGKMQCLVTELDDCYQWLENFCSATREANEKIMFSIFCGDFNFDNMSPGDQLCANHKLFNDFLDPCRIMAGSDFDWTIGTEFRQPMLWEDDIDSPEKLQAVLTCPKKRRCFIIDANVKEQTMELANLRPPYNEHGEIAISFDGGKRRIDYILHHRNFPVEAKRYYFVTALTQLTDHLPVVMAFEKRQQENTVEKLT